MRSNLFLALSLALLHLSCGGGGGTSSVIGGASNNIDPKGIWIGNASTGYTVNGLILDTGESWGFYTSGSTIYGALYGNASASGNRITLSGTDFNFASNTSYPSNLIGTITPGSSISLSGTSGSTPVTLPLTYQTALSQYTANGAALVGSWDFVGRSRSNSLSPGVIMVDGSGRFTLNQFGCTTTGTIAPRSTRDNVYNISLTSVGGSCAVGQSPLNGVAYLDTTTSPNRFWALALNSGKTDGLIVIGTKR